MPLQSLLHVLSAVLFGSHGKRRLPRKFNKRLAIHARSYKFGFCRTYAHPTVGTRSWLYTSQTKAGNSFSVTISLPHPSSALTRPFTIQIRRRTRMPQQLPRVAYTTAWQNATCEPQQGVDHYDTHMLHICAHSPTFAVTLRTSAVSCLSCPRYGEHEPATGHRDRTADRYHLCGQTFASFPCSHFI